MTICSNTLIGIAVFVLHVGAFELENNKGLITADEFISAAEATFGDTTKDTDKNNTGNTWLAKFENKVWAKVVQDQITPLMTNSASGDFRDMLVLCKVLEAKFDKPYTDQKKFIAFTKTLHTLATKQGYLALLDVAAPFYETHAKMFKYPHGWQYPICGRIHGALSDLSSFWDNLEIRDVCTLVQEMRLAHTLVEGNFQTTKGIHKYAQPPSVHGLAANLTVFDCGYPKVCVEPERETCCFLLPGWNDYDSVLFQQRNPNCACELELVTKYGTQGETCDTQCVLDILKKQVQDMATPNEYNNRPDKMLSSGFPNYANNIDHLMKNILPTIKDVFADPGLSQSLGHNICDEDDAHRDIKFWLGPHNPK